MTDLGTTNPKDTPRRQSFDDAEPTAITLANGRVARYWRLGSGRPVLYLRSFVVPAADDAFVAALSGRFDLIVPEPPGHRDLAELADLDNGHDLAFYYDDLRRALDLDRWAVIGHSFGGFAAAELADHLPEPIEALALIAPLGLWRADDPTADLARVKPASLLRLLSDEAERGPGAQDLDVDEYDADHIVTATQVMTATLKFIWPFPDHGFARRLYRIAAPTRIYWGSNDAVVPSAYAEDFASAIPGATVELLPGGHLLIQDQPTAMAQRIRQFLAASAPASATT